MDEIDAAALTPGEEDELLATRERLRNVERLRGAVQTAWAALSGDEERAGAHDLVGQAALACGQVGDFDPALARQAEALDAVSEQLDDAVRALRRYLDTIEDDPEQLQAVEERLLALADLKRKYGDTIEEILAYAERAREPPGGRRAARTRSWRSWTPAARSYAPRPARWRAALAARRAAAAVELQAAVEAELADLNMRGTRFVTQIERVRRSRRPAGRDRRPAAHPGVRRDGRGPRRVPDRAEPGRGAEGAGADRQRRRASASRPWRSRRRSRGWTGARR